MRRTRFSLPYTFFQTRPEISRRIYSSNTTPVYILRAIEGRSRNRYRFVSVPGEKLRIDLQSSAENCHIRIDRGTVRLEETFLGLSRSKTLLIHNRSNHIVKYKWMLFESVEADNERKEQWARRHNKRSYTNNKILYKLLFYNCSYKKLFQLVYENELPRCVNLDYYTVCTPDIHQLIYQRIYMDQLESLVKETFEYKNMYFMFSPIVSLLRIKSRSKSLLYRSIQLRLERVSFLFLLFFFLLFPGGRNLAAIVRRSDSLLSRGGARWNNEHRLSRGNWTRR